MKITTAAIVALEPCRLWNAKRIRKIVGDDGLDRAGAEVALARLGDSDARWVLARLLTPAQRAVWASACAARAAEYAAAGAAGAITSSASYAAANAAANAANAAESTTAATYAAAAAATAAIYAAAATAERKRACQHALDLIFKEDTGTAAPGRATAAGGKTKRSK